MAANKNDILKQILDVNTHALNNKNDTQKYLTKIDEIIKNSLNIDNEWDKFKMHFEKVHPNFFEKLKQKCPDLTDENLKLCAYIKM